jgi:hypothetical protein
VALVVLALVILAAAAVVIVALVSVGAAVAKTAAMPDQIVIDAAEGIEFCAQALPVEVTAVLSYDELRRLLRLHLEWVQAYHWAPEGDGQGPILFEELDPVDYIMERAGVVGLDVTRQQVVAVIGAHSSYLQVMGVIHLDDPVSVEADLAELPLLDTPHQPSALDEGPADAG